MKTKSIATMMVTLFLASMLSMAFNVTPVAATSIIDTMDADWDMSSQTGLDGFVDYGYSTDMYTSVPSSIFAHIWGWGTRGQDFAKIFIKKTFLLELDMAPVSLKLNYLIDEMTDGDMWGGMASHASVSFITHDAAGKHVYKYIVAGATTNVGDWSYDYCRDYGPNVKYINWYNEIIPAPGHGELEPPTGVWYTLDRNVDADFSIDWSTVTVIEILLKLEGGYLHADHFEVYFDDLELGGLRPVEDDVPPVANAGPDQTVYQGAFVTFDGSGSTDNVGIVSYVWTFVDVTPQTLTGVSPTYTFTTAGTYTVTLNVTDWGGNHATDTVTITVLVSRPGPKIDRLRFAVIKGAGGGGYSQVPVEELFVDGFDEAFTDWSAVGASPYLDAVDFPANYIEETEYSSLIGFFSFENTTLGASDFDSGAIEAYAMSEDPEIDGDIYLFAGPYSWVWAGSIEASSQWSWTKTTYILDLPSYLLDPVLINDMKMVIHYWTPDGISRGTMRFDAAKLILSCKGDWVPSPPVLAMQNCEVDVVTDLVRTENIEKLDEECYTVSSSPGFHICHIGFNIRPDQNYKTITNRDAAFVLSDVNFRHALFHLYNQEEIVSSIYGYTVTPVQSLVPPAQGGWANPETPTHPYNPGDPTDTTLWNPATGEYEDACSILRYGGYLYHAGVDNWVTPYDIDGDGTPGTTGSVVTDVDDVVPPMRLWTPTFEVGPTSAEHGSRFVSTLHDYGLSSIVHDPREFANYISDVFHLADFDMYMMCWGLGRFPTHLYDMTHSSQDSLQYPGGGNAPGINDPELDALTEVLRFSLDHDAKVAAAHEAQSRLYDPNYPLSAFAYMNLYSRILFNVFKPGLEGAIDSPGFGSDNMWTFLNMHWQSGHPNERSEYGESTVIWCLNDEPELLNPLYAYTTYAWEILDRVYDPLTAINPYTHEDEPWLATDWEAVETPSGPGAMEVTFWLRDDIYWHDGNPYTAEDARFNWLFLRDNQIPRYASTWGHILDVEVLDTHIVKVCLDVTSQWLLYDLVETAALLPPPIWGPLDGQPLTTILSYDPSADTTHKPGVGPKFGTEECPTCLYGTGPFVFQFYDPAAMYADLYANGQYFKTTTEIQTQIAEMFHRIGDVNYDGIIDDDDMARIYASYGKFCWMPGYDPDADLNSDCVVDGRDLGMATFHYGQTREVRKIICYIPVYVDTKPGSWPNPLQLKSKGVLTIAICGTEEFNVTTINPETIRLTLEGLEARAGVAPIRWNYEDVATPYTGELGGGHDLNGDGYLDLVLKFKTPEVKTKLELDTFVDETIPLIITGYLKQEYGTTPIRGQDFTWILK